LLAWDRHRDSANAHCPHLSHRLLPERRRKATMSLYANINLPKVEEEKKVPVPPRPPPPPGKASKSASLYATVLATIEPASIPQQQPRPNQHSQASTTAPLATESEKPASGTSPRLFTFPDPQPSNSNPQSAKSKNQRNQSPPTHPRQHHKSLPQTQRAQTSLSCKTSPVCKSTLQTTM
jgi:hypothetical protein